MSKRKLSATVISCAVLTACVTSNQNANLANDRVVCKKVYHVSSHIPKTVCGPTRSLTEFERERLRKAIGGPILSERDVPGGDG
jgi:hypothetical protein